MPATHEAAPARKILFVFRHDPTVRDELARLAEIYGTTPSDLIRRAVDDYLWTVRKADMECAGRPSATISELIRRAVAAYLKNGACVK